MVTTTASLETRYKALTHPLRLRALMAFGDPHGRVATTARIASELGLHVDQLSYHVRTLVRYGWLELVEESRKAGTGVIERFYRATQIVTYNSEQWAALSPAERRAVSEQVVALMVADMAAADDAGSLWSRADTHLSRVCVLLDDRAWTELDERLMDLYAEADRVGADSVNRIASGETPEGQLVPARFMTLLFEAPAWSERPREERDAVPTNRIPSVPAAPAKASGLRQRLSALTHPARLRAIHTFIEPPGRRASAVEIAAAIGFPLETTSYHVRALVDSGWIEAVEPASGDRVYHAPDVPAAYHYEDWSRLSDEQRAAAARQVTALVAADVTGAAATGSLDARLDRHTHRAPLLLDAPAWQQLEASMTALARDAERIAAEAAARLASGEAPPDQESRARLAMLLFEAPPRGH